MQTTPPLIQAQDLSFGYNRRETNLDHVNLAVYPGDYLAIIGPNGGGKTTLLKLLLGLLKPRSGRVVYHIPGGRKRIGYVPQFSTFERNFPLRVAEVVLMGCMARRGLFRPYRKEDRQAVARTLERLRLGHLARAQLGELSGGQLQRVLIARALVAEPALLFLDEPTASIDADSRSLLTELLRELNQRIPIVVVTHDITALAPVVKQIACVNRSLYYHPKGELNKTMVEEVYGCPVDLIAHGVPHRVLAVHDDQAHTGGCDGHPH